MAKRPSNRAVTALSYLRKIERTHEEIAALNLDMAEIYRLCREDGLDPRALRGLVMRRQVPAEKRAEKVEHERAIDDLEKLVVEAEAADPMPETDDESDDGEDGTELATRARTRARARGADR